LYCSGEHGKVFPIIHCYAIWLRQSNGEILRKIKEEERELESERNCGGRGEIRL
jgi:hypothetical protein